MTPKIIHDQKMDKIERNVIRWYNSSKKTLFPDNQESAEFVI